MRLKLTIAYAGGAYHGWQRQPDAPTVQGILEGACGRIADREVVVTGAGRTDAGVHARGQVAHADLPDRLDPGGWRDALNSLLPADIRVLAAEAASDEFHARYGATRKRYVYCIDRDPIASPFRAPFAWHVPGVLDVEAMQDAAARLAGRIDQRAFATRPDKEETVRPIEAIEVRRGETLDVTVTGRSFLRFVVRGLVGSLVAVGRGSLSTAALLNAAAAGDRDATAPPAPAQGLFLDAVEYGGEPAGDAAAGG